MTLESNNIIVIAELDENMYDLNLLKDVSNDLAFHYLKTQIMETQNLAHCLIFVKISHSDWFIV